MSVTCRWQGKKCTKPPEPNRRLCAEHLRMAREQQKRLRERRKELGICVECSAPLDGKSRRYCIKCRLKWNAHRNEMARQKRAARPVKYCLNHPTVALTGKSTKFCPECREKWSANNQRRLQKQGRCRHCGQPRGTDGNRNYCRVHANDHTARAVAWQQKQIALGNCRICGKPRGKHVSLCDAHAAKARERYHQRKQRKQQEVTV